MIYRCKKLVLACKLESLLSVPASVMSNSLEFFKSLKFETNGSSQNCCQKWNLDSSAALTKMPWRIIFLRYVVHCLKWIYLRVKIWVRSKKIFTNYAYFIDIFRRKEDSNDHPTTLEFLQRTRLLLAENIFDICCSANCEPDEDFEITNKC